MHTYKNTDRWWSKGHGSLIDTPEGKWMVVYHSYENGFYNLGRQTLMEPVELTEDGWFKTYDNVDIEKAIPCPIKIQTTDNRYVKLNEFRVGLEWKFYKSYEPERITVKDKKLTFKAKGTGPPYLTSHSVCSRTTCL